MKNKFTTYAFILLLSGCSYFDVSVEEPECIERSGKCSMEKEASLPAHEELSETVKEEAEQK